MGLLHTIQAILGGSQPDAPEEHPADTLLKQILSGGGEADPGFPGGAGKNNPIPSMDSGGKSPSFSGSDTGALNEVMGMPPDVAAKVTGNPAAYPNLAAILGGKQTKVPPRKPLDYLIAAASPLANAFASMMMTHRRSDRKAAFFSGLASGGLNTLASEAGRSDRMKQAQREKDIQDILLQQRIRGTPIGGVEPGTDTGVYKYPGTGETLPGIAPTPHLPPTAETRERTLADGSTVMEQLNRKTGQWETAQRVDTTPDTTGKPTRKIVPFTNAAKKPVPKRELKVGSDVPGGKKNDEQYYWVSDQEGEKPKPTGLYRSAADKPTREGDINRAEKHQVNQWAVKALADSHKRLGPGKKPEEYANDAVETFRQASGTSKDLASKSSEVSTAIRNIGRNVRSGDELAQLVAALLGDQTKK